MIWILITVGLIIGSVVVLLAADDLCSDILFGLAATCLTAGLFMGVIFGGIAIYNHIAVDKSIHETEMQYEALTKQLYMINSEYEDVSKTEVMQKVYDWNVHVHNTKYWSESPWTNWLYSKKYEDSLKYIEMDGVNKWKD